MKIMRLRHAKLIVAIIVVVNLILFYYSASLWRSITATLVRGIVYDGGGGGGDGANGIADENADPLHNTNAHAMAALNKARNANKHLRKSITIVFRNYYTFENGLKATIDNILDIVPNMPILVLQDTMPYPPFVYERNSSTLAGGEQQQQQQQQQQQPENSVRFINLGFDIQKSPEELNPLAVIHTKYVLFMPDSVRLSSKNLLQKILREMNAVAGSNLMPAANNGNDNAPNMHANGNGNGNGNAKAQMQRVTVAPDVVVRRLIIVPFASNMKTFSSCTQINLDLPHWTLQYVAVNSSEKCDLYIQKHAILVDVGVLRELPEPFATPFPEMFYIQAKLANLNKTVFPQSFQDGRRLFASYHTKQRRLEVRRRQFKDMYKKLQIKRIVRRSHKILFKTDTKEVNALNGPQHNLVLDTQFSSANFSLPLVTEIDLIGCERTTKSCIGPVYNQRPFYVYLGKHTPPCCLDKLKTTFNHVLEEFENVGIRYWLDNHALRSAIETNQLAPDAYDIDISFNVDDLERSNAMKKSQNKPYVDNEGFYWIKATDGHYFRVQFSKMNQIGVNLLPFEITGNRVKSCGFFGWKAKEFSADYLHPMSTVLFLGKNIMCPNNVREFLEFKNF